jgi:cytochrome c oxidase cbb3-type subunit III
MKNDPEKQSDDIDYEDLRDHVFDGIQEYDKKLPNWWLMTLYGSIVFSIGYWFFYHTSGVGLSPEEKFAMQQQRVTERARASGVEELTNEALFELAKDETLVAAGRTVYASNCVACHGLELEGGIGSSLKNGEWKYGSEPLEIRRVILDGAPAGGMPSWRPTLGEQRVNEVTAFILAVNPSLAHDEQGEE